MTTAYQDTVLFDTPLLYWPLDANANDISGNARHGTVTGTWNYGVANALSTFLGLGSSAGTAGTSTITTPSIAWPSGVITIEMWADIVIDSTMFWGFTSWDSWTNAAININNGSSTVPFAAGYPTTGMHHLVWVFQQGVSLTTLGKLYVDGVLYASAGGITTPTLGTQTLHLSGWNNDAGYRWTLNRFASNFAVYNSELTLARVTDHYQSAFGPSITDAFGAARQNIVGAAAKSAVTTAFTTEASEPLGNGPALNTAWATVIPPANGVWQIDTIGSDYDTALAVYTGSALGSLTLVKADDSSGGSSNAKVVLALDSGRTYYVQGGGANGATGGTLKINASILGSVLADDFLAGGYVVLGTLSSSAANPTSTTLTSNPDAETIITGCDLSVVPGASVAITYDLQGSQNAGGQGKGVTWRVRRDNLAGAIIVNSGNRAATIDSSAGSDAGINYSGSFNDSSPTTGHYVLTSEGTGAAITTTFIARSVFTLVGAPPSTTGYTTEASEPLTMPIAATGWVRFRPTISGYYTISTVGSAFDTGLAVYSGSALTALTLLASDNNSGASSTSIVTVHLTAGTTYPIQVGSGSGTASGNVLITLTGAGYDVALIAPAQSATQLATAWMIKGRSSKAQDALPGG